MLHDLVGNSRPKSKMRQLSNKDSKDLKRQHITAIQGMCFLFYHQLFSCFPATVTGFQKIKCWTIQAAIRNVYRKSKKDSEHHFPSKENTLIYTYETKIKSVTKTSIYRCTIEQFSNSNMNSTNPPDYSSLQDSPEMTIKYH